MVFKSGVGVYRYLKMEKFVITVTYHSRLSALRISVKSVHLVAERLGFDFGGIILNTSKIAFATSR